MLNEGKSNYFTTVQRMSLILNLSNTQVQVLLLEPSLLSPDLKRVVQLGPGKK